MVLVGTCATGTLAAILDVEEAEVERDEEAQFIGTFTDMPVGCPFKGKAHELSGSDLKDRDGRTPGFVKPGDGVGHGLVDEFLADELFCYHETKVTEAEDRKKDRRLRCGEDPDYGDAGGRDVEHDSQP